MKNKRHSNISCACNPPQLFAFRIIYLGLIAAFAALFALDWRVAILGLLTAIAWVSVTFAVLRMAACLSPKPAPFIPTAMNSNLPRYTVLVPLFHEANMVRGLMQALEVLRYPRDRLEIFLICEEVDPKTIAAVSRHIRPPFKLIIAPKGLPQTKPRALNYALQFANGNFITIYDAEDRPHKDQLLTALSAFNARPEWAALQAPLDYFNAQKNWLTRQFSLEYAALFHVWIPWLTRLKLPFPLGGTSNHIRREPLEAVSGWDAHNVTEDADLSFRLAANGHEIGYITPPTQEEAVSRPVDWHFQRARWIKGFMQTWQVHMSQPFRPHGAKGLRRFICLQLTLGITLLSVWFYVPAMCAMGAAILWLKLSQHTIILEPFYIFSFVFSVGTAILIGGVGAVRANKAFLLKSMIFMPAYWCLLFAPSLRAFWDLKRRPFHWHKTQHGVSSPKTSKPPRLHAREQELNPHEPIK